MAHQLSEIEIREVLARAEEIHARGGGSASSMDSEAVLRAAEEAGLPREAVEQALRERLDLLEAPPNSGDLVFAKSSDGRYYVAEVVDSTERSIRVRFLKGGEHARAGSDLRPCRFLPGGRITVPWPGWGWWGCTIVSYDATKRKVKVYDGWSAEKTFPISEVRLDPSRRRGAMSRAKAYLWLAGVSLLAGGALGGLATWLLMR